MNNIKFRIAAKTDVGLVRTNNEDNFQAAADLSTGQMRWTNNEICSLGDKGALLVVADGMGGMNAGEVASEIAIETIRDYFALSKLTPAVTQTRFTIEKYMNDAIIAADSRIKAEAQARPETKGMGTTIVLGWLLDGKLYVSWCGDSRAYIYNPDAGLHQISKDHSYVQSLVDKGSITHEEAFDFPDSNIITRCLSDGSVKAKPESLLRPYELCDHDIVLFCTDGLCGMIRDEEIESVIRANEHNMDVLVDRLIQAACDAEGSDNVTICLCQILQGGGVCNPEVFVETDRRVKGRTATRIDDVDDSSKKTRLWWAISSVILLLVLGGGLYWWFGLNHNDSAALPDPEQAEAVSDSIKDPNPSQQNAGEIDSQTEPSEAEIPEPKGSDGADPANAVQPKPNIKLPDDFGKKPAQTPDSSPEGESIDDGDELNPVGNIGASTGAETQGSEDDTEQEKNPIDTLTTKGYIVRTGDTYFSIAKKYKTTVEVLQKLNKNKELKEGMMIHVPTITAD
jgi:protein phosphatase